MAKLTRFTQLIFGSTASANQIAEYGSLANSTPATYSGSTITPAIVQALSQYLSGWFAAAIGPYAPAIEDMNALCYLFAYQLAYGFQEGIPEWDSGTTYYIGSLCQSGGYIYSSLTDSNLNHAVTSIANWSAVNNYGVLTTNTMPASTTVLSGNTMTWPYLTVPSPYTMTVNSGGFLSVFRTLTVASGGTLTVNGTSTIF